MKEIQLTQGQIALVDDEDFENLNQFRWCAVKIGRTFYAVRNVRIDGKKRGVRMHCQILGGKLIDHKDHNGLNNQKSNLRFCTASQNCMNKRKRKNCVSIYKGVCFHKQHKRWLAHIKKDGKDNHLGYFVTEIDAAKAYNIKAVELFGEFANLNKLD